VPSGTGVGRRTVHGTDHPVGFCRVFPTCRGIAPCAHRAGNSTEIDRAMVVVTKSATAPVPLVTRVGYAKSQNLKPAIGLPSESLTVGRCACDVVKIDRVIVQMRCDTNACR